MDADRYLAAIVDGDPGAFGAWVAVSEPTIRRSVMRYAAHVDIECVTQECLLRVWQAAPTLHPDGKENALLRWSIRVARNLALSELRRRAARPLGRIDPKASPEEEFVHPAAPPDPLLRRVIAKCRETLPAKPAQALAARLDNGGLRPDTELASELGMKLNTFLQNFGRARRLLRTCLERHGVDLEQT